MTRYIVEGRYCPTNRNPETEAEAQTVEVGARDLEEAKMLALWYRRADDPSRDGKITEVV